MIFALIIVVLYLAVGLGAGSIIAICHRYQNVSKHGLMAFIEALFLWPVLFLDLWRLKPAQAAPRGVAECSDPDAPIHPCLLCGKPVRTCESPGPGPDYRCPAHGDGAQVDAGWACSSECWEILVGGWDGEPIDGPGLDALPPRPVCVDPEAPTYPCLVCWRPVHTCIAETGQGDADLCPAHPDGVGLSGPRGSAWVCSDECLAVRERRSSEAVPQEPAAVPLETLIANLAARRPGPFRPCALFTDEARLEVYLSPDDFIAEDRGGSFTAFLLASDRSRLVGFAVRNFEGTTGNVIAQRIVRGLEAAR